MFQGRTTAPNFLVLNTDFLPGKTWDLQNISYSVVQDWMLPPINPMLQPLLQILPFVGVTGETSSAGCTLLASLLCSYTPDIWSCFCAWNINIGPWRKWLLNTAWEKCSWEHCKYHFPIYNMHSRAMQCKVMSVCMRVCVCEREHGLYMQRQTIDGEYQYILGSMEPSKNCWLTPAPHRKLCQYELHAMFSFKAFYRLASGSAAIRL